MDMDVHQSIARALLQGPQRWLFKHRTGRPRTLRAAARALEQCRAAEPVAGRGEHGTAARSGPADRQRRVKNWDALAALDLILANTQRSGRIFDAGGERYSMILALLWLYGYRHLIAGNLAFRARSRLGPIVYEYADITRAGYPDNFFDAVTCLSVIEHGVDLWRYFEEMSRIIAPGGLLITSTDYWETPVDTRGQRAYGVPIHIFTRPEIVAALDLARSFGFESLAQPDLCVSARAVHWEKHALYVRDLLAAQAALKSIDLVERVVHGEAREQQYEPELVHQA